MGNQLKVNSTGEEAFNSISVTNAFSQVVLPFNQLNSVSFPSSSSLPPPSTNVRWTEKFTSVKELFDIRGTRKESISSAHKESICKNRNQRDRFPVFLFISSFPLTFPSNLNSLHMLLTRLLTQMSPPTLFFIHSEDMLLVHEQTTKQNPNPENRPLPSPPSSLSLGGTFEDAVSPPADDRNEKLDFVP